MSVTEKDRLTEYLSLLRHYSNIRFLMLPIFFSAMAAIGYAYFQTSEGASAMAAALGALLSVIFFKVEGVLDAYITKFRHLARDCLPEDKNPFDNSLMPPGYEHISSWVGRAYFAFGAVWLLALLGAIAGW